MYCLWSGTFTCSICFVSPGFVAKNVFFEELDISNGFELFLAFVEMMKAVF